MIRALLLCVAAASSFAAAAAPDEAALGRDLGYPPAPRLGQMNDEAYIVGSYSSMDRITAHCTVEPSPTPVPLKTAAAPPVIRYQFQGRTYTLDDYMQHQRATAVLVLKDGEIVAERYSYGRTADMRMLSNSMAKTVTALAVGKALEEGSIKSLDDKAEHYVPGLKGSLYGGTRIVDLLRMASGARYVEDYTAADDRARFNAIARREGVLAAARSITERDAEPGQRFNYAGAQTEVLGLVVRGATGRGLCDYVGDKLWRPLGAQAQAVYMVNPVGGTEIAQGGFNATARDYARLGLMLANDGEAQGRQVISKEFLRDMTDASRQPPQFRPGQMDNKGSRFFGYGFQTWILPADTREFALLGIHGQAIFVDPARKLVMVHLAVGKDASGDASGAHLGAERTALWRGVLRLASM